MVITSVATGIKPGKYAPSIVRDDDPNRMVGGGVLKAVDNINNIIAPQLIGKDPTKQTDADQLLINLDNTETKKNLGANSLLVVSQAVLKAGALSVNMPLYYYLQQKYQLAESLSIPTCIYSMFNGGSHGAENLDLKDFSIIPASHFDFPTSLNIAVTFFQKLEEVLISKEAVHCVGKVGGFAPNFYTNTDAFDLLIETTKATQYTFAQDIFLGIDASASHLFADGKYTLKDKSKPYSPEELATYYKTIRSTHQVIYIEDPFQEDDWKSWEKLTTDIGDTTNIVSDRLTITNKQKLKKAISEKAANSIAIKPIQAGTISETIDVIKAAKDANWQVVVSHRSGETNEDFLADLGVGVGANYVRFGAPNRGERVAKYNRLMEIYNQIMEWSKHQS
jgi:enolase